MSLIVGDQANILRPGDIAGPHGFSWGFVALEYYAFIANRVMAVLLTGRAAVVLQVGGMVAAPHDVTAEWYDPLSFVAPRFETRYAPFAAESDELLRLHRANRRIALTDITSINADTTAKWGMGTVPYSGRIFVATASQRYEFILLGNQDMSAIVEQLNRARMTT
jgi:hypothetical protein